MAKSIPIFKGSAGLNTKTDPARIRFNSKTGINDLAACVNCDIDDTGRIFLRAGQTATSLTGAWKNLFGCGIYGLGTKDGALAVIEADMSSTNIRNVTAGARMSYVRDTDGTQDIVYYSNNYEKGRIINKLSYTWPLITPVGVTTLKEFYEVPIGHILCIRNSRMFIAKDNILYYSEPNTYYAYRLATNFFGFPSRLKMVQNVDGGLWVSDSESIYFLAGEIAPTLNEMPRQIKKCDCPALEGTNVEAPASRIGIKGLSGIVTIFTTTKGICIGSGDGQLIPVTEHKIDIPSGLTGSAVYRDGKYIVTIS